MRNILLLLCSSLLLAASSAQAGTVWNLNFTDSAYGTFSGKLTTDDQGDGTYLVTGLSGTYRGHAMTLLAPDTLDGNDNLMIGSDPWFTLGGVAFEVPYYGNQYLLWEDRGAPVLTIYSPSEIFMPDFLTFELSRDTGTPEPAAASLLAGGLALIAWRMRRRS